MSIKYRIHQDPPRRDGQPAARHLRTLNLTSVNLDALADEMNKRDSVFSVGTIAGVLTLFVETMGGLLAKGAAVYVDDLGTFQPHIGGDVEESAMRGGGTRTRIKDLRVSGVDFRPDADLLHEINQHARFEHVLETRRTAVVADELTAFLAAHFATHPRLLRHHLEDHFYLSKRRALSLLDRLVAEGRLKRKGQSGNVWYEQSFTI